jgi:hypothetical protein
MQIWKCLLPTRFINSTNNNEFSCVNEASVQREIFLKVSWRSPLISTSWVCSNRGGMYPHMHWNGPPLKWFTLTQFPHRGLAGQQVIVCTHLYKFVCLHVIAYPGVCVQYVYCMCVCACKREHVNICQTFAWIVSSWLVRATSMTDLLASLTCE